jgi:hypothetical protein
MATYKLVAGGRFGRWEEKDGAKVFVQYTRGDYPKDVHPDTLARRRGHFILAEDELIELSAFVTTCKSTNVRDVRPLIVACESMEDLQELADHDTRVAVKGFIKQRLDELTKKAKAKAKSRGK